MRWSISHLAFLLALALPVALAADAPAPKGRAYLAQELAGLLDGLGYDTEAIEGQGRSLRLRRGDFSVDVNVFVSEDGAHVLLYAPTRAWTKEASTVPDEVLLGMLRRSAELGPTRFYATITGETYRVGLLRPLDNRAVRPVHVREALDELFEAVRRTEDLWNPERWGGATPASGKGK